VIRAAILILALGGGALHLAQLRADLAHETLFSLEEQIRGGRFEPDDMARLEPLAEAEVDRPHACRAKRSLAFVKLYRADLLASKQGAPPLAPSDNRAVTEARDRAAGALRAALRCMPMDGDLWLRLAALDHALGAANARVARLFELSRETMPYEGSVMRRRQAFAPRLGLADD
jgi:hypothetical protein